MLGEQSEMGAVVQTEMVGGKQGGLGMGNRAWWGRDCRQAQDGYLGVTKELGNLPLAHGAHDGLPHGQLELLADDELHGLAPCPAVIQHGVLIITVQRPVVKCCLWATRRLGKTHTTS